jgi:phage protein D
MPDTITIVAKGSRVNGSLKLRRTLTYFDTTVGEVLDAVAGRSGMAARVSADLRGIKIKHLNQVNESDQNLLSRLKRFYDAEFKSVDSNLLFYLKDDFKKVSGEQLEVVVIDKMDCTRFAFEQTDRSKYQAVSAKWRDVSASEVKEVLVGSGQPVFVVKELFSTQQEANDRATTKYNNLLRGTVTGDLTCIGNPLIAGEFEIVLTGFRAALQTNFKCVSTVHTIDNNGYLTSLKVVNKK